MDLGAILSPERRDAARRAGLWPDRLPIDDLDRHARERPDQVAVTDHNSMTGRATTLSYRQLKRFAPLLPLAG